HQEGLPGVDEGQSREQQPHQDEATDHERARPVGVHGHDAAQLIAVTTSCGAHAHFCASSPPGCPGPVAATRPSISAVRVAVDTAPTRWTALSPSPSVSISSTPSGVEKRVKAVGPAVSSRSSTSTVVTARASASRAAAALLGNAAERTSSIPPSASPTAE